MADKLTLETLARPIAQSLWEEAVAEAEYPSMVKPADAPYWLEAAERHAAAILASPELAEHNAAIWDEGGEAQFLELWDGKKANPYKEETDG
jgi:hypothetical protein